MYIYTLTAAGLSVSSLYLLKMASALVLMSACFAKNAFTSALRPSSYSHSDGGGDDCGYGCVLIRCVERYVVRGR